MTPREIYYYQQQEMKVFVAPLITAGTIEGIRKVIQGITGCVDATRIAEITVQANNACKNVGTLRVTEGELLPHPYVQIGHYVAQCAYWGFGSKKIRWYYMPFETSPEKPDFLKKYWWIIVLIVLVLVIVSFLLIRKK